MVVVPFGLLQAWADYEPDNLPRPIREPFIRVANTIAGSLTAVVLSVSPCDGNRYSNWTVLTPPLCLCYRSTGGLGSIAASCILLLQCLVISSGLSSE